MKGALNKSLDYIDEKGLLNEEDEYVIIYSDEKFKTLTGKDNLSEEVFGQIIRENLKVA